MPGRAAGVASVLATLSPPPGPVASAPAALVAATRTRVLAVVGVVALLAGLAVIAAVSSRSTAGLPTPRNDGRGAMGLASCSVRSRSSVGEAVRRLRAGRQHR